jgi:hypothetical protein
LSDIESLLLSSRIINAEDLKKKLRNNTKASTLSDEDEDEDNEARLASSIRSKAGNLRTASRPTGQSKKNIRGPSIQDDDSDFDL